MTRKIIGALLIIGAIALSILTTGLLLPFMLPLFFYGAKLLGLPLNG